MVNLVDRRTLSVLSLLRVVVFRDYNKLPRTILNGIFNTALSLPPLFHLTVEKEVTVVPASKPASGSPSLTSMMLNQSSVANPIINSVASPQPSTKNTVANNTEQSEEDHISKLDIRVGIVRSVSTHPDAESLYIEQGESYSWNVLVSSSQANILCILTC